MRRKLVKAWVLACVLFASNCLCLGDSLISPEVLVFASENKQFLLHIVPKDLGSPFDLPERRAGYAAMRNQSCVATLYGWDADTNAYRAKWTKVLQNEVCPLRAVVSPDGRFVATVDDYGNQGYGDKVVVVYNSEGEMVSHFSLEQLLSKRQLEMVAVTTSSRIWSGTPRIREDHTLELQVRGGDEPLREPKWEVVRIDLNSGKIVPEK